MKRKRTAKRMKRCTQCCQQLPLAKFGVNYGKPRSACKECESVGVSDVDKLYWSAKAAVRTAAKRGKVIEFTIAREHIIIPKVCPVFGRPLVPRWVKGPWIPSLDRIDSTKGYTPDNIRVVSWLANKRKRDLSFAEVKALYRYFLESDMLNQLFAAHSAEREVA